MPDNRKALRVESKLRCWCEGQNVTVFARVGNLSEGGLFLKTSTPLSPGSRAMVRFSEVEAPVLVVWASQGDDGRSPGMGLQFESIDEQRLEQIRHMIRAESGSSQSRG